MARMRKCDVTPQTWNIVYSFVLGIWCSSLHNLYNHFALYCRSIILGSAMRTRAAGLLT